MISFNDTSLFSILFLLPALHYTLIVVSQPISSERNTFVVDSTQSPDSDEQVGLPHCTADSILSPLVDGGPRDAQPLSHSPIPTVLLLRPPSLSITGDALHHSPSSPPSGQSIFH